MGNPVNGMQEEKEMLWLSNPNKQEVRGSFMESKSRRKRRGKNPPELKR